MSARIASLTALCAIAALGSPSRAAEQAPPIMVKRFGLFVVSDDLNRAAAFYERIFGTPQIRVPGMVGFEVAEGLYAVVDRTKFARTAVRGDTTRGYMRVADIGDTYKMMVAAVPGNVEGEVSTEGKFSFFRVRDPDGNRIEFYAVKP